MKNKNDFLNKLVELHPAKMTIKIMIKDKENDNYFIIDHKSLLISSIEDIVCKKIKGIDDYIYLEKAYCDVLTSSLKSIPNSTIERRKEQDADNPLVENDNIYIKIHKVEKLSVFYDLLSKIEFYWEHKDEKDFMNKTLTPCSFFFANLIINESEDDEDMDFISDIAEDVKAFCECGTEFDEIKYLLNDLKKTFEDILKYLTEDEIVISIEFSMCNTEETIKNIESENEETFRKNRAQIEKHLRILYSKILYSKRNFKEEINREEAIKNFSKKYSKKISQKI